MDTDLAFIKRTINSYRRHSSPEGLKTFGVFLGVLNQELKDKYPYLDFALYGRLKSQVSSIRKIKTKSSDGKVSDIYDFLGCKLVIKGINLDYIPKNDDEENIISSYREILENAPDNLTKKQIYELLDEKNNEILDKIIEQLASNNSSVHSKLHFSSIKSREKNYSKDNGYQSKHLTFSNGLNQPMFIEIHGRTAFRDLIARGNHSEYKENFYQLKDLSKIDVNLLISHSPKNISLSSKFSKTYIRHFLNRRTPSYVLVRDNGDVTLCSQLINCHQFYKASIANDPNLFDFLDSIGFDDKSSTICSNKEASKLYNQDINIDVGDYR